MKKLIISFLLLVFSFSLGSVLPATTQCANASHTTSCAEDGYKNWNSWWWHSDGVDCWCTERENVTSPCSTTGGNVGTDPEYSED